jgi:phage tail sheath protein FI
MAELLRPGVFIREVPFGPQPIEGVSTSTAGFVGEAERGSIEGPPTLVTSFTDFERAFGGATPGRHLWYALRGFFENGGRRAYVARVVAPDANRASLAIAEAGLQAAVLSPPRLDPVNDVGELALGSVAGVNLGDGITLEPRGSAASHTLTVTEVVAAANVVRFSFPAADRAALRAVSARTHYADILITQPASPALHVEARDPGSFGARVGILLEPVLAETTQLLAEAATDTYVVSSVAILAVGDSVQVTRTGSSAFSDVARVEAIDAAARTVELAFRGTGLVGGGATIAKIAWRVTVLVDGAVVEALDGVSARTEAGRSTELQRQLGDRSRWIRVSDAAGSTAAPTLDPGAGLFALFDRGAPRSLAGGSDGSAITGLDIIGTDTPRTGLKAIEAQQGISIVAAPGAAALDGVVGELLAQAERGLDRFAVFESIAPDDEPTEALAQRGVFDSKYAAMYYPWVEVLDPVTRARIAVPPTGHVLGAFARTDSDRGVFKAPASVPVRGILAFSRVVSDGEQEVLNPAGVNALRRLDGLGDVIWGARTISSDSLWRYVPVRRLFIFLEQSIVRGTRFAVFEPNDRKLWARLDDSVTNFLTSQWRAGALFGATPEEAFFVKVDETTTTQDDRDNGRVNIIVGIAPVKPAEFIVFQIGQAPSSVIIAEQS